MTEQGEQQNKFFLISTLCNVDISTGRPSISVGVLFPEDAEVWNQWFSGAPPCSDAVGPGGFFLRLKGYVGHAQPLWASEWPLRPKKSLVLGQNQK